MYTLITDTQYRSRADVFEVSTNPRPGTIMDFDDDTNPDALAKLEQLRYPCPGAPALGREVARLLRRSGLPCEENERRGLDHGVWTPLYVMFPQADVPVCCLSIRNDLDPAAHILAGRALDPLRRRGVLVLGSGEAVHNVPLMGARSSPRQPWCIAFEGWLEQVLLRTSSDADAARDKALANWKVIRALCAVSLSKGGGGA